VLTAENVILTLKVAVVAVTVLLAASLTALARGNYRLHGRINLVFFALTLTAVFGLEVIIRLVQPDVFVEYFERPQVRERLNVHLCFSMPSTFLLLAQLYTGLKHLRRAHIALGLLFLVFWTGTFITGVFFLPHTAP
jgi:hypothetical protein